jgi:hypothetical protein
MDLYWTLVFLHVIAFAYWLGVDFGVYVTGGYVARADLPLAERLRTAIVLLPVLGLQIAAMREAIFLPEWGKLAVWLGGAAWVAIVWGVFARRGTPFGERLQRIDVTLRYIVIAVLVVIGTWSLIESGPVKEKWLAAKFLSYATLLAIGLYLRSVIKAWRVGFIELQRGPSESAEQLIALGIQRGRRGAWLFWAIIALTAYLGVAKPF